MRQCEGREEKRAKHRLKSIHSEIRCQTDTGKDYRCQCFHGHLEHFQQHRQSNTDTQREKLRCRWDTAVTQKCGAEFEVKQIAWLSLFAYGLSRYCPPTRFKTVLEIIVIIGSFGVSPKPSYPHSYYIAYTER
jgi:hypothetical protein